MKKRILALILCMVCAVSLFCACSNQEKGNTVQLQVEDYNPNITHPEGSYYEVDGKLKAEGGLVALGKDFLKLMIKGEEIEFALSANAQEQIEIFNKNPLEPWIKKGTMLVLTYENENLVKVVYEVEILNAN